MNLRRRCYVDQGGGMEKLSEKNFKIIQEERGNVEAIAEFFPLVPESVLQSASFAERLSACVYAEHSDICRFLPEMQAWLLEAVDCQSELNMASEHITTGSHAELLLAQKMATCAMAV